MHSPEVPRLGLRTALWRAVRRRCPSCGERGISRHAAHVDLRCPACDFNLEEHPGSFIGGIGVNTVVAFGCLLLVLVVGFAWTKGEASVPHMLIATLAVSVIVPIAMHARSRLAWAACELVLMPPQPGAQRRVTCTGNDA